MTSVLNIARKNAEVTEYSSEELEHFRKEFTAEVNEWQAKERRSVLPVLVGLALGFGAIFTSFLLFQPLLTWLFVAGITFVTAGLIFIAIIVTVFERKLICPACHLYFIEQVPECCPECGSSSLEPEDRRGGRHCNLCGKDLRHGKNRNFKYKACSHCGVLLYEKGL